MKKSTLIALAVFGALALAFVATRESNVAVGVHKLELAPIGADSLTEVAFGPIVLRAEGGAWTVGSSDKRYPADEGEVKTTLQAVAELKAGDFVTERPEKHAELEVDTAKGLVVKASTATGVVRELLLGKASRSGGAYVRDPKSNEVFVTSGGLPYLARRELAAWRKKAIATVKAAEVKRLSFTPPTGAPWALVADGSSWKLEAQTSKDYRFDAAAAQQVVAQLANLRAQGFPETPPQPPLTVVKAELADGKSVTLQVGAKGSDGTYPLAVEGDAQNYTVAAWQAEQLLKDPEGLRDTRLLRFDPTQVERVSLVAAGKKALVVKEAESWKLVEPKTPAFEFDPQQVSAQLTRLSSLRGEKLARDAARPKPAVQVELALKGGATQRLELGDSLARADDGLIFFVSAQDKSWLESGPELFKKRPPPPTGMQGLEQLPPEIRAQLEQQLRQQQGLAR